MTFERMPCWARLRDYSAFLPSAVCIGLQIPRADSFVLSTGLRFSDVIFRPEESSRS